MNVRHTYGNADELVVDDFLEDWPQTAADVAELERRALNNPLYRDLIISSDAS